MSHAILEGPVKILKIVTPGAYWIRCAACEGSSRLPSSIKHKLHGLGNECYYPHQGDKVFVKDKDGFFYRGTICGRRELPESESRELLGTWKYVVQLTDTFQVKDFFQHDVYPTYGESSASCQSAHLVSLYYVLPRMPPTTYGKCVKIGTDDHKIFENVVKNWDQSVQAMAHLTGNNAKFSFVQSKLINGCVYGELSTFPPLPTQTSTQCYSLSDYLHLEKLGIHITFRFDDVVDALMTNPLIDYSELLATFDPSGKTSFKPKPSLPLVKAPEPVQPDFSGFKVHPDDVALHQSLIQGKLHFVNIFFSGAPLEDDTIVRYVCPDGKVVLGTVMSIDIKVSEVGSEHLHSQNGGRFKITSTIQDDYTERFNPDRLFDVLDFSDTDDTENFLKDFDESYRNFKAAGGVFEDRFMPYPLSLDVEDFILHHLKFLGVGSLHEWQVLCLPSFSSRKNLVVVGPKSTGKLSTTVICALSWMRHTYGSRPSSIHPQLIIFVSDIDRADKTASLCTQLTNFRVIVSTSSIISLKQKEIAAKNGCDVLITTPSNWAKLVSLGVFDYSQLKHAIFDEFDRLNELYTEELVRILQALQVSCTSRIQTMAVSNTWSDFIGEMIVDAAMCIMDVLFSCLYYKLTLNAVFVEHHHWIRQLEDVIRKCTGKRLLLCKDKLEGQSIAEQVSRVEDVLFVHEVMNKETALKTVKEWDKNGDKLLVCTDSCFEEACFIKNVDLLISWMTPSRTALSKRFKAFIKNFGFNSCLSSATAYLFCDSKNLDELLLVRNIAPNVRFINGSLEEHISRASFTAERAKRTPICPSIFMFGKCDLVPTCPHRHLFRVDDDPQSPHLSQFLKVNILKVHSAFRYSVRVTEIISNYDQHGTNASMVEPLMSHLEDIEDGLAKCRRNPCSTIKIGDMVGVCVVREKKTLLRRAVVKFVPEYTSSDLYLLSIFDFEEPDVCLPLSQLFVLPKGVAKHPKDVVDLYISGLLPADSKSDWKNDTGNFVRDVMKNLTEDLDFFSGKVHMVTAGRSALVDTLHCFKEDSPNQKMVVSLVDSEFFTLKHLILESGYCVENVAHLPSLSELLVKSISSSYDSIPPLSAHYSRHYLLMNHVGRFGFRTNLPSVPVQAVVSSFDDPGLLYVQLTEESEQLKNFENDLSSALNLSRKILRLVAVDELCAVQYQGTWNRVIICDIIGDVQNSVSSVHIMSVDHGDKLVDVKPNRLYCLPAEFLDVPFFAIQCDLVGIKPLIGDAWDEETVEQFVSYVRTHDGTMEDLRIKFCGPKKVNQTSKFFTKQTVVLWELHHSESINFRLVRGGLADFDRETKHLLKRQ